MGQRWAPCSQLSETVLTVRSRGENWGPTHQSGRDPRRERCSRGCGPGQALSCRCPDPPQHDPRDPYSGNQWHSGNGVHNQDPAGSPGVDQCEREERAEHGNMGTGVALYR
eukprot:14698957-Alexandrium_andersonii.AAC.1